MFNRKIRNNDLRLLSNIADVAFKNIDGDDYNEDRSLIATLRALLAKRVDADEKFFVHFDGFTLSRRDAQRIPIPDFCRKTGNSINVISVSPRDDDSCSILFDKMTSPSSPEQGIKYVAEDMVEVCDVEEFLRHPADRIRSTPDSSEASVAGIPEINAKIFYSESLKSAYLFVERLDVRKFHYLQVFTSRYLPWFFRDKPLDQEEIDMLKTLANRRPNKYIEAMQRAADRLDFRNTVIKTLLTNFQERVEQTRLDSSRRDLQSLECDIADVVRNYKAQISRRDQLMLLIEGLEARIHAHKADNELLEFFSRNKNLELLGTRNHTIQFIVKTYLTNFDPDMFERYADNEDSHIWRGRVYRDELEDVSMRRKLMDAIFSSEPTLKIKMCGRIDLDVRGSVSTEDHYRYSSDYSDCIPNPHLNIHSCFGNNRPLIEEPLRNGDIIGGIIQSIASVGSVNIAEGVSFGPLLDTILSSRDCIIELPDGKMVTNIEALNWLCEQEAAESDAENTESVAVSETQPNTENEEA